MSTDKSGNFAVKKDIEIESKLESFKWKLF